jgi:hypothetical protein
MCSGNPFSRKVHCCSKFRPNFTDISWHLETKFDTHITFIIANLHFIIRFITFLINGVYVAYMYCSSKYL